MSSRRALGAIPARGAVLALALALGLTACSDDDEPARSEPTPQTPPASATPASPAAETDAECSVPGFVPTGRKTVQRQRTVVVYASSHSLAPGSSTRGAEELSRADVIRIRVVSPAGTVPKEVRDSVLRSVGRVWSASGPPELSGPHRFDLTNPTTDDNQTYVVYRAADVVTGSWAQTMCGAPYNDGTEVERMRGTFSGLTAIRPVKTYLCGSGPTDADQRAAARLCRI